MSSRTQKLIFKNLTSQILRRLAQPAKLIFQDLTPEIVWNDEIDLAADNLRAEAVEQSGDISHERIWNWMHRNNLTLDTAASALGISRRMLAYYRNGEKHIPKHIWFACLGWEHFGNGQSVLKLAA